MTESETANTPTPVLGFSFFVSFVALCVIIFNLPHGEGWVGSIILIFISVFIGAVTYGVAYCTMEIALKVIVEIAGALLFFSNALFVIFALLERDQMLDLAIELGAPEDIWAWIAVMLANLLILFITNLIAFLVLYPLAQIAGTTLIEN